MRVRDVNESLAHLFTEHEVEQDDLLVHVLDLVLPLFYIVNALLHQVYDFVLTLFLNVVRRLH